MKAPDAFRTISEVAEDLDLPQHVLRFWETRFNQIKPMKRGGGRRYYRPEDIDLLRGIRLLLYAEGFTIRGVQRLLKEKGVGFVAGVGQAGSSKALEAGQRRAAADGAPAGQAGPADRPLPALSPGAGLPPALTPPADDDAEASPIPGIPAHAGAAVHEARRTEPARPEADRLPPGSRVVTLESRRKIEAALADLLEAKRLLDQVR